MTFDDDACEEEVDDKETEIMKSLKKVAAGINLRQRVQ